MSRSEISNTPRLLSLIAVILFIGCSSSSNLATVSGEVTLDGVPLKTGAINFRPKDGKAKTAGAVITDGKYSAKDVPTGRHVVEISAAEVVGKADPSKGPGADPVRSIIPEKYNVKSELELDVKPGENQKVFALTTK